MVVPAAPIVPGYEDGGLGPRSALDDRVHLIDRPLHPMGDVAYEGVAPVRRIGRVLAGVLRLVDPRYRRHSRRECVLLELVGRLLVATRQALDEVEYVAAVVGPGEPGLVQLVGQGRELELQSRSPPAVARGIVDDR